MSNRTWFPSHAAVWVAAIVAVALLPLEARAQVSGNIHPGSQRTQLGRPIDLEDFVYGGGGDEESIMSPSQDPAPGTQFFLYVPPVFVPPLPWPPLQSLRLRGNQARGPGKGVATGADRR